MCIKKKYNSRLNQTRRQQQVKNKRDNVIYHAVFSCANIAEFRFHSSRTLACFSLVLYCFIIEDASLN